MRLALGTVQFGLNYGIANQRGQVSLDEMQAILSLARASGIDTLDTAVSYGESEARLGAAGISNWRIISKLPAVPGDCTDIVSWTSNAVDESLQRLRIGSLNALLLHRPQQLVEKDGDVLYDALQRLKSDGRIRKIGVSIYDPEELDMLLERYHLDIVQAPFSILDRRIIDSPSAERLHQQGGDLHVRSVFLQGLLLMNAEARPVKFERWQTTWECWDRWLANSHVTPLQACVRYALSAPRIDRVVVGVDSARQLLEIISAADGPLPHVPDELRIADLDLVNPARWNTVA